MTAALAPEESPVPASEQPLPLTGDDETDEALAMLRTTTGAIHDAQDEVADLSQERRRLVLDLRRRGVKFSLIAAAAQSTEQTIFKVHRVALREEAHDAGDHTRCTAGDCPVIAARESLAAEPESP